MFTGIVQDIGRIAAIERRGSDMRLTIETTHLDMRSIRIGDSVSVQGCCLTAVDVAARAFAADLSAETLAVTTLADLIVGAPVNLEAALRAGEPLGGHLVSGHVDGIGIVSAAVEDGRSRRLNIAMPAALARFIAPKGSVTMDGVSLTVNEASDRSFGVNIIPHTQTVTTLGRLVAGARVNLEVDQIARYVARLMVPVGERPSAE